MISRCPSCQKRLPRKSVACKACGWTLGVELDTPVEAVPVEQPEAPPKKTALEMHLQSAIDSISRQQFSDALNSLNRAIVDAPQKDLAEIYSLRGYAHLMLDDFRRAEADCTTSIEKRGPDSETLAWRAAARGHQNRWRSALEDLTDAKMLANSGEEEYTQLIETYRQEATRYFGELVQQGKSEPDLFCHRGWVYLLVQNHEKAKRDFQLALNRDPNHHWSLLGSAEIDVREQKPSRAQEICEKLRGRNINEKSFQLSLLKTSVRAWAGNQQLELALQNLAKLREESSGHSLRLLDCGRLAMEIGDYVTAIDDFTQILKDHPQFITAWRLRGESFAAINNFQSAENDFSEAIDILGSSCDAAMYSRRGEMRLAQDKIEDALEDFDAAEEYDNVKPTAFLSRARAYLQQELYEQAMEECEKALRLDNTLEDTHFIRGQILFEMKQHDRAIAEFRKAIELSDDEEARGKYHYQCGASHYEMDQLVEAVNEFEQAEKMRPSHAGTQVWKAAAFSKLGAWPEAIQSLQLAIAKRPAAAIQYQQLGRPVAEHALEFFDKELQKGEPNAELFKNRGMAYQFLGNVESALENYTRASEISEFDEDISIRLGQMRARKGNHRKAIDDFTEVVKNNPGNHFARYCRAISLTALKKSDKAWRDIQKASELEPNEPRYLLLKGELLQQQNKPDQAIQSLTRTIALDPNDSLALRRRGISFASIGQNHKAIGDFTRSLDLNPRQSEVFALRGNAHFKNGDLEQAKEDFEIALTRNEMLVKAYTGRAMVLAAQNQHESAVIWLTKTFHRFKDPRQLAELLLARGKIFFQMGRFLPSINDFTIVMDLRRDNISSVSAARYGRALALVQQGELGRAESDLAKVVNQFPSHRSAEEALNWIRTGEGARPASLEPPAQLVRPHRPSKKRKPVELVDTGSKWDAELPHGDWIVRQNGKSRKEYGPVPKSTLDQWCREGRLAQDTRILRSDWKKWRKASFVYPELLPQKEKPKEEEDSEAPKIKTKPKATSSISSMPVIETQSKEQSSPENESPQ